VLDTLATNPELVSWWQAAILGLVEGITEYLPVSSTGHLIIASALMGLDEPPAQKAAVDAFNIVIQGGAILAVLGLYRVRVLQMIRGLFGRDAAGLKLAINLIIAFLPAAVFGVLFDDAIEARLFYAGPVLGALFVGGVLMIAVDRWMIRPQLKDPDAPGAVDLMSLTWRMALFIGFMQCLAMWPGTSRSMMTIVAGVLIGLKPRQAAEFSFLLGLPTLGGACVYKLGKNLSDADSNMFDLIGAMPIIVGIAVATISAAIAIRWLVGFLTKHGLTGFGIYRIILAVVLGILWQVGVVNISPDDPDGSEVETTLPELIP
jgi:undecaprenyl-diphosphatase